MRKEAFQMELWGKEEVNWLKEKKKEGREMTGRAIWRMGEEEDEGKMWSYKAYRPQ
jgi:hypothetical protein